MAHKAAFKCQLPSTKSMLCIIAPSVRTVQVIFFLGQFTTSQQASCILPRQQPHVQL